MNNEAEIRHAASQACKLAESIKGDKALLEISVKDCLSATQKRFKKESEQSELSLEVGKLIGAMENNRDGLLIRIDQAKLKTTDLDKRDPECKSSTCSFIISALTAQKDIPKLEARLAEQRTDIKIKKEAYDITLNNFNAVVEALRYQESEKTNKKICAEKKITEAESELAKYQVISSELPAVETALTRKADLEKRKAELAAEGLKIKITWENRITEKEKQKKITGKNIRLAREEFNKDADNNMIVINNNIALIKSSATERTNKITELSGTIISLEKEIAIKEQASKDFELKTSERNRIINELAEWVYLKNACGKDGLRALEIDSVAPVVTGYANDLMLSTFGTGETIKIKTLDEETGREVFAILVIRENGKEVLLDDLSGGEKVWNLKALRLAMTQIAKEKSGKNFLCAFADEDDGSLDVENAKNFVRLYRAFMPSGGFNDCYFISHKPECVAMADHVVEFRNGGIRIN